MRLVSISDVKQKMSIVSYQKSLYSSPLPCSASLAPPGNSMTVSFLFSNWHKKEDEL